MYFFIMKEEIVLKDYFFFQAEGGIRDRNVTGVQTCALPILGKETRGRWHVKLGRGGLVDVEFLAQALQLVHGAAHAGLRAPSTTAALGALGRLGLLPDA